MQTYTHNLNSPFIVSLEGGRHFKNTAVAFNRVASMCSGNELGTGYDDDDDDVCPAAATAGKEKPNEIIGVVVKVVVVVGSQSYDAIAKNTNKTPLEFNLEFYIQIGFLQCTISAHKHTPSNRIKWK